MSSDPCVNCFTVLSNLNFHPHLTIYYVICTVYSDTKVLSLCQIWQVLLYKHPFRACDSCFLTVPSFIYSYTHLFIIFKVNCFGVQIQSGLQAIFWDQNLQCILPNKQHIAFIVHLSVFEKDLFINNEELVTW